MRIARQNRSLPVFMLALLVVTAAVTFSALKPRPRPVTSLSLSLRSGSGAATSSRLGNTTDDLIARLQDRIRANSNDINAYNQLGNAYLQRVRETGDPSSYGMAEAAFKGALERAPNNLEAVVGQGALALARHDFRKALALGEQARALNSSISRVYGVIADAQIELGMYEDAVKTTQVMVDMRPDLSSYTRVSYLRELNGDPQGAIEAMQAAVTAGGPNAENTQWTRVQLGNLFWNQGDLQSAERQYQQALVALPDYLHALAGLARVRGAQARYDEAIALYTRALKRMPVPEYVIALGDVYARKGDKTAAKQQYDLVQAIAKLFIANGVNMDLETALFFADHDLSLGASLQKARAAYAARPSIQTADGLAWTLYKTGNVADAQRYAAEALRLQTRDPIKLFHAGMIAKALGQRDQARRYLQAALNLNPRFSLLYDNLARTALDELNAQAGTAPKAQR